MINTEMTSNINLHKKGIKYEILRTISSLKTIRMQLMEELDFSLLKSVGKSPQSGINQPLLLSKSNSKEQ